VTQIAMGHLYAEASLRVVPKGPTLVAACVETERHELGLRMVCDLLELDGWDTTFLGATVPGQSLAAMVRERRPDVVALSVSTELCLPALRSTIQSLRKATAGTTPYIIAGGRPFHDNEALAARVGADATAADASAAVHALRERLA
jgi:methanogenic corrinoid protein MtbC1